MGHLIIAFLHSPASSGSQEAETEIPVVQSLHLDDDEGEVEKNEEKSSEGEQQREDKEAPPPTAASSSPPPADQSESTDAAGTTEVEPEPNKNLIELETAEEKNSKTLEVR